MQKLKTITALHDPALKFDSKAWGIIDTTNFSTQRANHVLTHVLAPKLRVYPSVLHAGEAEAFLLAPLLEISYRIHSGEYEPGDVISFFAFQARIHGVAAEVLATAQDKASISAWGQLILERSPLMSTALAKAGDPESPMIGRISRSLTDVLKASWTPESGANFISAIEVPGSKAIKPVTADIDAMIKKITTYGGLGKGAPLFPSQYAPQIQNFVLVERACRILMDPALIASTKKSDKKPCPLDAYALALGFLAYLHFGFNTVNYETRFIPQPPSMDVKARVANQARSTRSLAWHWAALASSAQIADVWLGLELADAVLSFFQPLSLPNSRDLQDVTELLKFAREKANKLTYKPVTAHSMALFNWYKAMYDVDTLLPDFMREFISMPTPPEYPSIPRSQRIPNVSSRVDSFISLADAMRFIPRLKQIGLACQLYTDSIANQLTDYFTSLETMDLHTLNLPEDLLTAPVKVSSFKDLTYSSAFVREFFPLSIPRYVYNVETIKEVYEQNSDGQLEYKNQFTFTPTSEPQWVLRPHQYGVVSMLGLRRHIYDRVDLYDGRYIYDVELKLPAGFTMSEKFASLLIPHIYVRHGYASYVENNIRDVYRHLAQASNKVWNYPNPFEDMAMMMESSPLFRSSMLKGLAAMFRIYRRDAKSKVTQTWVELVPDLPTIYGIPRDAFIAAQEPVKLDELPKMPDNVRGIQVSVPIQASYGTGVSMVQYAFVLYSHMPKPDAVFSFPFLLDLGVHVSVPVSKTVFAKMISESAKALKSKLLVKQGAEEFNGLMPLETSEILASSYSPYSLAKITEVSAFVQNEAWSTVFALLPHIFFSYQPGRAEMGLDQQTRTFIATKIRAASTVTGSTLMVSATIDDDIVVIEEADYTKILNISDVDAVDGKTVSLDGQSIVATQNNAMQRSSVDNSVQLNKQELTKQETLSPGPGGTDGMVKDAIESITQVPQVLTPTGGNSEETTDAQSSVSKLTEEELERRKKARQKAAKKGNPTELTGDLES